MCISVHVYECTGDAAPVYQCNVLLLEKLKIVHINYSPPLPKTTLLWATGHISTCKFCCISSIVLMNYMEIFQGLKHGVVWIIKCVLNVNLIISSHFLMLPCLQVIYILYTPSVSKFMSNTHIDIQHTNCTTQNVY